jgi:transcriptional regulator with XRE-family HTH domain
MSIPKLEKELNLGNGAIYKWDKSSPSIDKLQKVAEYFNVSTDYLLYGFDRTKFSLYVNYARHRRSVKEFSDDTGINEYYLTRVCSGVNFEQPTVGIVERIAANNQNEWIVDRESLFMAAGYNHEELPKYKIGETESLISETTSKYSHEKLTKESALTLINNPQELAKLDKETLCKLHSYIGAVLDFSNKDDFTPKQFELLNRFYSLSPIEQQTILSVMKTFEEEKKTKSEQTASLEVG